MIRARTIVELALVLLALMPTRGLTKHFHQLLWENSLRIYVDYDDDGVCCNLEKCKEINCPEALTLTAEGINPPFCFLLPMGMSGGIEGNLEQLKKESIFKDGYGFIHTPCHCNAHGANGFMAFKLGDKPKFLGYLQAYENPYSDGKFYGFYEPLEAFGFGSHAESQSVALVMREKNGNLSVNADETWGKNKVQFSEAKQTVQSHGAARNDVSSWEYHKLKVAVLDGAQILKYLNKQDEMKGWLELAKSRLLGEDFSDLNCMLEAVQPFEMFLDDGKTCAVPNNRSGYDKTKDAIDKCHGDYGLSTNEWMTRLKRGDPKAPNFLSARAAELADRIPELKEIFMASNGMQTFNIAYLMKDLGPKVVPVFKEIMKDRNIGCELRDQALWGLGWTHGGEQDAMKEAIWAWKEDRDCLGRAAINIFSENPVVDPAAKEALLVVLKDPLLPAKLDAGCGKGGGSSQIVGWAIRGLAKYPDSDSANAVCKAMVAYGELGAGTYALEEIARKLGVSPHSICSSLK